MQLFVSDVSVAFVGFVRLHARMILMGAHGCVWAYGMELGLGDDSW